jgi:hypothetical protein
MTLARLRMLLPACLFAFIGCSYSPYFPPAASFSGDSRGLKQTIIVPAFDTPMPKGKNVLWCGTFQLAWDQFKTLVGPMDIPAAHEAVCRLNNARMDPADLPKGSYYAAAGRVKDGIIQKIRADMKAKFPHVEPNLGPNDSAIALAYSYLAANVKFHNSYFDREGGDEFTDSSGNKTRVSSFGMYKQADAGVNSRLAEQIDVLYTGGGKENEPAEYVLDLDKNSNPSQLILACVEPKDTLAATWQDVRRKIDKALEAPRRFTEGDRLDVPNLNYEAQHNFKELEENGRYSAGQSINFRLDKSGATLVSEAHFMVNQSIIMGRNFSFTRPFLIVMRKRGASEPYFVMWVDNAELLCKP